MAERMNTFDCLAKESPLYGFHFLEASAGTGKTFALQHIFTRFILHGIPTSRILLVTFTKASTRDLKRRIRANLFEILERCKQKQYETIPYLETIQEDPLVAEYFIEKALIDLDDAAIYTIHSFCFHMLATFCFEADFFSSNHPLDEADMQKEVEKEIYQILRSTYINKYFHHRQFALLFKSYKQEVKRLIRDLASVIQTGTICDKLCPISEICENLNYLAGKQKPEDWKKNLQTLVPKYKGLCDRGGNLHQHYKEQIDVFLKAVQEGFTPQCLTSLLSDNLFLLNMEKNYCKKGVRHHLELPLIEIQKMFKKMTSPSSLFLQLAQLCKKKIGPLFEEKGFVRPDDLLTKMQTAINNPIFVSKIQQLFDVVAIDEFQDTDPMQWDIFYTLFFKEKQTTKATFLVGDPKQSIYSFRNADLRVYLKAKQHFLPEEQYFLATNFRSLPGLIEKLNTLFSEKQTPHWLTLGDPTFSLSYYPIKAGLSPQRAHEQLEFWLFSEDAEEVLFAQIAYVISEQVHNEEYTYSDFAILVKDRFQAEACGKYLNKRGIPIQTKGGKFLSDTEAYIFLKLLFIALTDPSKLETVRALMMHPFLHIPEEVVIEGVSHPQFQRFCTLLYEISRNSHFGISFLLQSILSTSWCLTSGKKAKNLQEILIEEEKEREYQDLMQLFSLLLQHAKQSLGTVEDCLNFLLEIPKIQTEESLKYKRQHFDHKDQATIMTTHLSKGLEFRIVFAIGLGSRYKHKKGYVKIQNDTYISFDDHKEVIQRLRELDYEKMRQLYVALTRAKEKIFIPLFFPKKKQALPLGSAAPIELFVSTLLEPDMEYMERYAYLKEMSLEEVSKKLQRMPEIQMRILSSEKERHTLHQNVPKKQKQPLVAPQECTRTFPEYWMHSFSSLQQKNRARLYREEVDETVIPLGKETGTKIHAFCDFLIKTSLYYQCSTLQLCQQALEFFQDTPLAPYGESIAMMVTQAFSLPLERVGVPLKEIAPRSLHSEKEFFYVERPQAVWMKGIADLLIEYQNTYYLLDWKTNFLGLQEEDYTRERIEEEMEREGYVQQARIYTKALQQYLSLFPNQDFSKQFGGMFYFFLRGLPFQNQGLYYLSPKQLIEKMDQKKGTKMF